MEEQKKKKKRRGGEGKLKVELGGWGQECGGQEVA